MTTEPNMRLGGTLGLGPVHYQGGRDELALKCRARDDEIDRLRSQLTTLRTETINECAEKAYALGYPGVAKSIRALSKTQEVGK